MAGAIGSNRRNICSVDADGVPVVVRADTGAHQRSADGTAVIFRRSGNRTERGLSSGEFFWQRSARRSVWNASDADSRGTNDGERKNKRRARTRSGRNYTADSSQRANRAADLFGADGAKRGVFNKRIDGGRRASGSTDGAGNTASGGDAKKQISEFA